MLSNLQSKFVLCYDQLQQWREEMNEPERFPVERPWHDGLNAHDEIEKERRLWESLRHLSQLEHHELLRILTVEQFAMLRGVINKAADVRFTGAWQSGHDYVRLWKSGMNRASRTHTSRPDMTLRAEISEGLVIS